MNRNERQLALGGKTQIKNIEDQYTYEEDCTINTLNTELNPICHMLELLVHHILHVSRIRVNTRH